MDILIDFKSTIHSKFNKQLKKNCLDFSNELPWEQDIILHLRSHFCWTGIMDESDRSHDWLSRSKFLLFKLPKRQVHDITFVKSSGGLGKEDDEFQEAGITGMCEKPNDCIWWDS